MNDAGDPNHFEFDLDRAIREQVVERLEASPLIPLARRSGPAASGTYALYWKGELVYVGKVSKETTKSRRTLRARLGEHVVKIGGRENIHLADVGFRYLTFESEWWVFAAEFALISHYEPAWNGSGYGSKVPVQGRPETDRISRWNDLFPKRADGLSWIGRWSEVTQRFDREPAKVVALSAPQGAKLADDPVCSSWLQIEEEFELNLSLLLETARVAVEEANGIVAAANA